jgi:hypothetical protein
MQPTMTVRRTADIGELFWSNLSAGTVRTNGAFLVKLSWPKARDDANPSAQNRHYAVPQAFAQTDTSDHLQTRDRRQVRADRHGKQDRSRPHWMSLTGEIHGLVLAWGRDG